MSRRGEGETGRWGDGETRRGGCHDARPVTPSLGLPVCLHPCFFPPFVRKTCEHPAVGGSQPMHPAIPAIVSLFVPGIGLLFVPNKAGLGLGIFAGYVVLWFILVIVALVTLGFGSCLFFLVPLANVAAAIHSWDEAAKASGGQFQPILFK